MTSKTSETVRYPNGRIVRYRKDQVGNDLTATLRWCATHHEPTWEYGDGTSCCPHVHAVRWDEGNHVITDGPWEDQTP